MKRTSRFLIVGLLTLSMAAGCGESTPSGTPDVIGDSAANPDTTGNTNGTDLPPCLDRADNVECADPTDKVVDLDPKDDVKSVHVLPDRIVVFLNEGGAIPPDFVEGKILTGGKPGAGKRGNGTPPGGDGGFGKSDNPFLRKVVSVSQEGNIVTVMTTQPALTEAFENLRIRRRIRVGDQTESLPFGPGSGSWSP